MDSAFEVGHVLFFVILVTHASRFRSGEFALVFWGGGLLTAIVRDVIALHILELYAYRGAVLVIFDFPLVAPLMWVNTAYFGLTLAEIFTKRGIFAAAGTARVYGAAFGILLVVGLIMGPLYARGLLAWKYGAPLIAPGGTPYFVALEIAFHGVFYIAAFRAVFMNAWPAKRRIFGLFIVAPLTILFASFFLTPLYFLVTTF